MNQKNSNLYSRRSFIGTSFLGVAGLSVFPFKSCAKPSDIINLGFLGLGRHGRTLFNGFMKMDGVRVVAGADVYDLKRERFLKEVSEYYKEQEISQKVDVYEDYRKVIDRRDIDAVVIASVDHWHALMAIDACKAGKDIYLEKPLTLTIKEGQELVKAVRKHNIILAVGSQQRSDKTFSYATRMVREGKIGKLEKVYAHVHTPPHPLPYNLPKEPVPDGLNWEKWLGPLPYSHFNSQLNPEISLDPPVNEKFWPAWRWYKEFSGGRMTDTGTHMLDVAHWGMGLDYSGPLKIIPGGYGDYEHLTYEYPNGLILSVGPFIERAGAKFVGSEGWIEVARGFFNSSIEALSPQGDDNYVPWETTSGYHYADFIDAVKSRRDPVAPVEIGHHTCVACTLGNIADEIGRPIEWNPDTETFVNDPEAEKYLHYEYQRGYTL